MFVHFARYGAFISIKSPSFVMPSAEADSALRTTQYVGIPNISSSPAEIAGGIYTFLLLSLAQTSRAFPSCFVPCAFASSLN